MGFPLWARLGLIFGLLTAGLLVVSGWIDRRQERAATQRMNRERMEGVATAVARLVDGDEVATWGRGGPVREDEDFQLTLGRLRHVREAAGLNWVGIFGRKGERIFYLMDTDDEDPLPPRFPYFDGGLAMSDAFAGGTRYREGLEDEWGRWDTVYAPVRDQTDRVVAVVAVDIDADWRVEMDRTASRRLALELAAGSAMSVLVALVLSRALGGHLAALTRAVRAVADGDLDQHVEARSRDEVGALARAFNQMVLGLRERDTIRDAFGRYVSPEFAQRVLSDPDAMRPGGQVRTVTIMFSDLRGFTALAESLAPDFLVTLLNRYLDRMGMVVERHGGSINEFLGDGILALFGAWDPLPDDAVRAVACAADMQVELERLNEELAAVGVPRLEMGIGLATGPVLVGNIGSTTHAKWGVIGDAVNLAARVESFTVGGEVLISEETLEAAGARVTVRGPIEVKAKGKKHPLRLHAVVKVGEPWWIEVPVEARVAPPWAPVEIEVRWWRIEDKQVESEAHRGWLIALAFDTARFRPEGTVSVHENLRVELVAAPLGELYAKVVALDLEEGKWVLHFTATPGSATAEAQIRGALEQAAPSDT